ncbi:MAG: 2Fe-2S iron-sulfur cluster-binding protein [Desulfobacula sp.]|jgi:predicted molibdopterin-dependent oxidoreductase YjgC
MIKIFIDGREIQAKENRTVLQTAKENGIRIPHLCYHPALEPSGSCKLCGVEVILPAGKQVVMLSCVLKAKENLEIKTDSELVQAYRKKSFNKLLQMAPDADRIRNLAREWGVPVTPPPDGCIRCRLCIRVCNEIVKSRALKMVTDENGTRVVPEPGLCIGCGTCANLCPTSLIRVKDQDGVRTVSIKEDIIGQLPLERCEGCGTLYATENFLRHVENSLLRHPDTKEHHHLCPSCIKLLSNRATAERKRFRK